MVSANERVRDVAQADDIGWRTAAYIVALSRLAKVYKERGIFPWASRASGVGKHFIL